MKGITNNKFKSIINSGIISMVLTGLIGCQSGPFANQPVPEPRYVAETVLGDAQVISVLPNKVPCNSEMPMLCMVVSSAQGDAFQIPYHWISGFTHTNGVQYQLSVKPIIDKNKQEMTGQWVLEKILYQQPIR